MVYPLSDSIFSIVPAFVATRRQHGGDLPSGSSARAVQRFPGTATVPLGAVQTGRALHHVPVSRPTQQRICSALQEYSRTCR